MSEEELDQYRGSPPWGARVAPADVNVREARVEDVYQFEPGRFADMQVPTLLLPGGDSPSEMRAFVDVVNAALPSSRIKELPGQQHIAHRTALRLVAGPVARASPPTHSADSFIKRAAEMCRCAGTVSPSPGTRRQIDVRYQPSHHRIRREARQALLIGMRRS